MSDIIQIQTTENKLVVTEQNNQLVIQETGANTLSLQSVGVQGPVGQGVPSGGTYGQVLVKDSSTNFDASFRDGVLITTVRNNTGSTLAAGTIVYINGMQGNRPTVAKAQANTETTSAVTYGMVAQDIADNADGPVVHAGQARNLNTLGVPEGVVLYLSPTVAGGYTATKPSAPDHLVYVGFCTRAHPTMGTIEVTIANGFELRELHDVAISSPTNKQALTYNSSTGLWNNYSLTAADVGAESSLGFTPENVANKSTSVSLGTSSTLYPTQGAVKSYVDTALTGKVDVTRQVATTAPLSGGGALSSDLSLSISQASTSTNGYLTSTDWNTFNAKQAALGFTPENVGNKTTSLSSPDNTKYPTSLAVSTELATKQATLVSGTNIKTINGSTILGSGDLVISGGGGGGGGVSSLNTLTGALTIAVTYTGSSITVSQAGSTISINIPFANGGVSGQLSNGDFAIFQAKASFEDTIVNALIFG